MERKQTNPRLPGALPSIEQLQAAIDYNPDTGAMLWRENRGSRARAGAQVGHIRADGYRSFCFDWHVLLTSRVAWALVHGEWPEHEIGHKDADRSNDAIRNLTDAPRPTHHANRTAQDVDSKGAALGVRKRGGRYHARFDGRHLGAYATAEQAHAAYHAHRLSLGKVYKPQLLGVD